MSQSTSTNLDKIPDTQSTTISGAGGREVFDDSSSLIPAAPRRNSIEDVDDSRPRKRLATMASSSTPLNVSSTTDREEHIEHDTRDPSRHVLQPSHDFSSPAGPGGVITATLDKTGSPDVIESTEDSMSLNSGQLSSHKLSPNKATVHVRQPRPMTTTTPTDAVEVRSHDDSDEETSQSPQSTTSAGSPNTISPSQETFDLTMSPDIEVHEVEDDHEDLSESVTVIGEEHQSGQVKGLRGMQRMAKHGNIQDRSDSKNVGI